MTFEKKQDFSNDEFVLRIGRAAVAQEIETHRRMGRSIVVWRDGKVAWIPPEEIEPRSLPGDTLPDDKPVRAEDSFTK